MKLRDSKIRTQLQFGLGAVLVLTALLGVVAWIQADSLWQKTQGLYEHPFTVRAAVSQIKADVLVIHREMKDLILAEKDGEIQAIIKNIDARDAHAARLFDVLRERYLGPRADIDAAFASLVQWRSIRGETIRLVRSGDRAAARERTRTGGLGDAHASTLEDQIRLIDRFASNKGEEFYSTAKAHKDAALAQFAFILSATLLLIAGIGFYLYRRIKAPLQELGSAAARFRQGHLDARSGYALADEFGVLSDSFNALAGSVQTEIQSKDNAAQITAVMLQEEALHPFCRKLLASLLRQTGSQVGAVYLLNDRKTHFEHVESIGLNVEKRASFAAAEHEGEFGAALASRQIERITDIPEDTSFALTTVSGDFMPREIMTIPILDGEDVIAVISLASVRPYSDSASRLAQDIWSVLTARMNGVLALQRIRDFSQTLETQNRELEVQKNELNVQSAELTEQNIELELQKQQLDDANRLKNIFLSNMSHELRTPLNSVIALSSVLHRRLANTIPAEEHGYLEVIERNGKNLLELINDILDLSRIESGKEEIRLSRFSMRELVGEVVATIEPQAREKHVALHKHVGEGLPPIRSDLAKCRHILLNLVANAVKFTPEGSVEIRASVHDDALQIDVADTGIGIAQDQIQYIFDEFRQADESMAKNYGGTGLGLAIARKYAALLQGSISVRSRLGEGSVFTLRLPLAISDLIVPQAAEFGTPAEDRKPLSADGHCKSILIVEDNAPAVIQLTDILTENGYQITVARDGLEAIRQIERSLPDAIVLDLMMPEVDGFEVLRTIRNSEKTAHIPVLILTAKHVTGEELRFLNGNHIHQLIQKGAINKEDLIAAIGSMANPRPRPASAKNPATPNASEDAASGKPVVLVVENDADNLITIRALLQDGYTVMEAAEGDSALSMARERTPDIILLDILLPGKDGFGILRAIKADEALRHIPVVAVTASAMTGSREEILSHGFSGYVSKPIEWSVLEKTIRQLVHAKR